LLKIIAFFVALPLLAQAPKGFEHWSAASLRRTGHELSAKAASDPHKIAAKTLVSFDTHSFMLAHREADGVAEWHANATDIIVVESGTATLVVGGTMAEEKDIGNGEHRGASVENGFKQKLAPGDIIQIPPKTPHQMLLNGAKEFTYFVVKVKSE